MPTVTVNSIQQLLEAVVNPQYLGYTVEWTGPAHVDSMTLQTYDNPNDAPLLTVFEIDFAGLTIDTVTVAGSTHSFNYGGVSADNVITDRWMNGCPAFRSSDQITSPGSYSGLSKIKNLTVNHAVFEHCRNIVIYGKTQYSYGYGTPIYYAEAHNVYVYDCYIPSVNFDTDGYRWFAMEHPTSGSDYWARTQSVFGLGTKGWFRWCIVNVRTENSAYAPMAQYYYSEVTISNVIDLKNTDLGQIESIEPGDERKFAIIPNGDVQFYHSVLNYDIDIQSEYAGNILFAQNFGTSREHRCWLIEARNTIFNFSSHIDRRKFTGNVLVDNANIWNPQYIRGVNPVYFSDPTLFVQTVWVTNRNDIDFSGIFDDWKQLYGDLRNIDVLEDHNFDIIEDEGWRNEQYDSINPVDPESSGQAYQTEVLRRINAIVNDGIPFIPMWYYPYNDTPTGGGDTNHNYISVYDMDTEQDGFDNNGLVLEPTRCTVTEELNGGYNLTLEHPKDSTGKWRFILEMNIIKCLGQLFIIRKVTTSTKANSKTITAYAEHISYHLNDYWLFPGTSIAGYRGQTLIDSILAQMWDVPWDEENNLRYHFSIRTNLDSDPTFREWYEMPEGHTPYEMILGNNGFTSLIGGELYRDNFNISIYERMEGASDDAFVLHPDLNLKSIQKTVDLQTFCTYFRGYGMRGDWFAVAWDPSTLPRAYPHNIVRSQNFSFDIEEEYYTEEMLSRKVMEYFKKNCAPLISFRIAVQDLKNHPEYKEFTNNYRFKVGDIGKVWDDEADRYWELEITKTVKDGITGECLEVVIGSERSFTRPNGYNVHIDRNFVIDDAGSYDPDVPPEPEPEPTESTDYVWGEDNERAVTYLYKGDNRYVIMPGDFLGMTLKTVKATTFCDSNLRQLIIPNGTEEIE